MGPSLLNLALNEEKAESTKVLLDFGARFVREKECEKVDLSKATAFIEGKAMSGENNVWCMNNPAFIAMYDWFAVRKGFLNVVGNWKHENRIMYWVTALIIFGLGDAFLSLFLAYRENQNTTNAALDELIDVNSPSRGSQEVNLVSKGVNQSTAIKAHALNLRIESSKNTLWEMFMSSFTRKRSWWVGGSLGLYILLVYSISVKLNSYRTN